MKEDCKLRARNLSFLDVSFGFRAGNFIEEKSKDIKGADPANILTSLSYRRILLIVFD